MRFGKQKFESSHLTCVVRGAVPGTSCIGDDYWELPQIHPSHQTSIQERNWRTR